MRITGQEPSLRVKGKRCGNNCLKGMNIGSGWEQKSIMQKCPFIFIIRTENSRNNQTVGRKATSRLRTSFRKPQAVTLSSLGWRNRQQPARIGRWRMVSDKVDFLARNCMGAMPDAANCSIELPRLSCNCLYLNDHMASAIIHRDNVIVRNITDKPPWERSDSGGSAQTQPRPTVRWRLRC